MTPAVRQIVLSSRQRPPGVSFNGSTSYLNRGANLTGIADGKTGVMSFWFRLTGGDGTTMRIVRGRNTAGSSTIFGPLRLTTGALQFAGRDSALSVNLSMNTAATSFTSSMTGWNHCMAWWNLAATTGNIYINGVNDTTSNFGQRCRCWRLARGRRVLFWKSCTTLFHDRAC
jgi:hypothetical protein